MRKILIISLALVSSVFARGIGQDEAKELATKWLEMKTGKTLAVKKIETSKEQNTQRSASADYHLVQLEGAWVIVAGDSASRPIIGYGDGEITKDGMPEAMKGWLSMIASDIKAVKTNQRAVIKNDEIEEIKSFNLSSRGIHDSSYVVKPLLWQGTNNEAGGIQWGQGYPYNKYAPSYGGRNMPSGCVAIALSQVMKYNAHPRRGVGSKCYRDNGMQICNDFADKDYKWELMPKGRYCQTNNCSIDERAILIKEVATAVSMNYSPSGSGAYDASAANAMRNYFKYDSTLYHRNYIRNDQQWMSIIKNELNNKRPLYYSGTSSNGYGGHAFVLDGYDRDNYFHFNWGWDGNYNGKFTLSSLRPSGIGTGGGSGDFTYNQKIITAKPIGVTPTPDPEPEPEPEPTPNPDPVDPTPDPEPTPDPVAYIEDASLKKCVERNIGTSHITKSEAKKITQLNCSRFGIVSTKGLQQLKQVLPNLRTIDLSQNHIDVFYTPAGLTVYGKNNQTSLYDIAESNNYSNYATRVYPGTGHYSLPYRDIDWYKFQASGYTSLTYNGVGARYLTMTIYDSYGRIVTTKRSSGAYEETLSFKGNLYGTYYVVFHRQYTYYYYGRPYTYEGQGNINHYSLTLR